MQIRNVSLPSRERGLKFPVFAYSFKTLKSLPSRERGLKYLSDDKSRVGYLSLPSRERGLKWNLHIILDLRHRRSLRGSVD